MLSKGHDLYIYIFKLSERSMVKEFVVYGFK